jgi:hypothetical protein
MLVVQWFFHVICFPAPLHIAFCENSLKFYTTGRASDTGPLSALDPVCPTTFRVLVSRKSESGYDTRWWWSRSQRSIDFRFIGDVIGISSSGEDRRARARGAGKHDLRKMRRMRNSGRTSVLILGSMVR